MRYHRLAHLFFLGCLALTGCGKKPAPPAETPRVEAPSPTPTPKPLPTPPVALPEPPPLTVEAESLIREYAPSDFSTGGRITASGRKLIYDYEVGGGEAYYNKLLKRPTWPGASSGVTIGIGYDLGYNSRAVILSDWRKHPERERLADQSGFKGQAAKSRVSSVRDIIVEWGLAEEVFDATTLTKFWQLTARTFPGFDELEPNAQAALVSLVFNRGSSLVGDRRREMREIKALVPRKDYQGIAQKIRAMKRIWAGTDIEKGMNRRRNAEAALVESCL